MAKSDEQNDNLLEAVRWALETYDATKKPSHPDNVVPMLQIRDDAMESLRQEYEKATS